MKGKRYWSPDTKLPASCRSLICDLSILKRDHSAMKSQISIWIFVEEGKEREEKEGRELEIFHRIFPLGGTGHPPTTSYDIFGRV